MMSAILHPFKALRKLRIRDLQVGSAVSGAFLLLFAVYYSAPNEFVRAPLPPGSSPRVNVVNYIETLTIVPVWTVLFVIGFGFLMAATARDKYGPRAHLTAGVVVIMYAVASFATAITNPGTYIVTATFALAFAFAQFMMQSAYTARHDRISKLIVESNKEREEYVALKKEAEGI